MNLRRLMTAAAALAALAAMPVQAQQPTAAVSPAKKELVQKVLQLQQPGIETLARAIAEQSVAPLTQQVMVVMQNRVAPDKREAVARDIQADLKKYGDEVVPLLRERATKLAPTTVGAILEKEFSEDELKQVIAILESPVNRKLQQLGNDMQRALTEKLVAETRGAVEPKLQALQDSLGKRLGLQQQGAASAPARAPASATRPAAGASR